MKKPPKGWAPSKEGGIAKQMRKRLERVGFRLSMREMMRIKAARQAAKEKP